LLDTFPHGGFAGWYCFSRFREFLHQVGHSLSDPLSGPVANRKTKYPLIADKLRTSINAVICFKFIPKFDGVPTTDFLPVYEIRPKYMYVLYISRFSVSSRPEIHSRYLQFSPKNWNGWYHRFFYAVESNDKLGSTGFDLQKPVNCGSYQWGQLWQYYLWLRCYSQFFRNGLFR